MSTASRSGMPDPEILGLDPDLDYPSSDGEPMAEDTTQYQWIVTIVEGIRGLYRHDPNVFVAGDLFWYPVEGRADLRAAPDALVAFGRPAGHRGSYMQFREDNIPPQVVFEVVSKSNRAGGWATKLGFYDRYGVEEYYIHDPHRKTFRGYLRRGDGLVPIADPDGWVSPRLGIRFDLVGEHGLTIVRPDGQVFRTFAEVLQDENEADLRAEEAARRAEAEHLRAERLAAKLRELGLDPDS